MPFHLDKVNTHEAFFIQPSSMRAIAKSINWQVPIGTKPHFWARFITLGGKRRQ
ncbi:hypothetical protein H6F90_29750 [Trichocoleus sp. FACHB-591]|uniref:hypothetical protein n=1 Tax=Trichocoleus sp. FACHB-591 TaxID=2692872 RepID=UPI001689A737|nr:hypothetical protein [Trichocoleus sp. FACHB-591]MBD2099251.1 hypothetical protein [Trichocoleus sp. FACHB-591]